KKIELIRRDTGGIAPDIAKRLAQELIVRDNVDMLVGFALTPNALAAGDVSAQAKKFMVNMNAATAIITTKSPYMVRTSFTVPQLNQTLGSWAYKSGIRKTYTMVSDFGPGHDGEAAFHKGFKDAGGEIVGAARYPVANQDFSAFVQSYKDAFGRNPDMFSVGAFDGMHVVYEALKKTGGKTDGESLVDAAKGMTWESPRGAMTIDQETRDVIQTVYIRRVEKVGGQIVNVE